MAKKWLRLSMTYYTKAIWIDIRDSSEIIIGEMILAFVPAKLRWVSNQLLAKYGCPPPPLSVWVLPPKINQFNILKVLPFKYALFILFWKLLGHSSILILNIYYFTTDFGPKLMHPLFGLGQIWLLYSRFWSNLDAHPP